MAKSVRIEIAEGRDRRETSDLAKVVKRLEREGFEGVSATGLSGIGDINIGLPTGGFIGDHPAELECIPPPPVNPIDEDTDPDTIGSGREVFERLTRSGNNFVPRLAVDFYRAVWFDHLEAYRPAHYDVSGSQIIVPNATLSSSIQVSARYVVK